MTKSLLFAVLLSLGGAALAQTPADPTLSLEGPYVHQTTTTPNIGPFGTYRALVVLVRFKDDSSPNANFDGWPVSAVSAPPFAYGLLDPTSNPQSFADSTVTRYLYDQSVQPSGQAFTFYGDVYPAVIETLGDEADYYSVDLRQCTAAGSSCPPQQPGGFGVLTQEVLGRIDAAGFDFAPYDQGGPNGVPDGVIDYIYILVRGTPYVSGLRFSAAWNCFDPVKSNRHSYCGRLPTYTAVSNLERQSGTITDTDWRPGNKPVLSYDSKIVNYTLGSYHFIGDALNPQINTVVTAAHEIGHDIWSDKFFSHLGPLDNNRVPENEPLNPAPERRLYGYTLMDGDPWGGVGGSYTISAHERAVRGWLQPTDLSQTQTALLLGDLYTTGDAYRLSVPGGRAVYLTNHQPLSWFDQRHVDVCVGTCGADPLTLEAGLLTTGLLATASDGVRELDVLPADNTLASGTTSETYEGDTYGPDTERQLTPWTMPNVNGCNGYASDPLCDGSFQPSWQAVDDIRYTGGSGGEMAFDYYADYRTAPGVVVRSDSWMGQETATSSGGTSYTFTKPVRVTNGAKLRVWEGSTITFAAGLTVEDGAEFICETGSTCVVEKPVLMTGTGSCLLAQAGATVRFQGQSADAVTTTAGGFLASKGGTYEFANGRDLTATATADTTRAEAGSLFRLSSGSSLFLGSPVRFVGTSAAPVRVERLASGSKWGDVELRADGGYLKHVVLDGGNRNVYVRSRGNTLQNVTSRNGWQNLQVYAQHDGGGRGQATAYYSLFEGAATRGVMAYSGDLSLQHSTVRTSAQEGLWVQNGDITFGYATITRNGIGQSRDGVALFNGADLDAANYALSEVDGNGRHELYTFGSAVLDLSYGYNSVCDAGDPGVTGKYVYEGGSYYAYAPQNWWGTASPVASMFYGDVYWDSDMDYPYAGDGCASSAAGSGAALASADGPEATGTSGVAVASARSGGSVVEERPVDREPPTPAELQRAVQEARAALTARSTTPEGPALAARLYEAQRRLDRAAPDEAAGERAPTLALFDALRQAPGPARERAALVALDDALRGGDAGRARALLDAHAGQVTTALGRAELVQARVEVLRQEGRYADALAALAGAAEALGEGYVSAVEAVLLDEAGEAEAVVAGAQAAEGSAASLTAEPLFETGLQAPYPNPTTGAVTVPVTLAEAGAVRVAVYDALGREVAVLADGPLGEGRHPLAFDGRALPTGVYVVRATVGVEGVAAESFVRRLTVAR